MTGRIHRVLSLLLAVAVLVILVSPAVPSPFTTLRGKHAVNPPVVIAAVTAVVNVPRSGEASLLIRDALLATTTPDLVDLTSARLC